MRSFSLVWLLLLLLLVVVVVVDVNGFGYLCEPNSRQVVAAKTGVDVAQDDVNENLPWKEHCPHCHSLGGDANGVCGRIRDEETHVDYTNGWVSAKGANDLSFVNDPPSFHEGQTISVVSILKSNHQGYIVAGLCADITNPTQACFDANPLVFVQDNLYGAPVDPIYNTRAYVPPRTLSSSESTPVLDSCGVGVEGLKVSHTFLLPQGVHGNVLLQWRWVTNLGCRSPGYDEYSWPSGWEPIGDASNVCSVTSKTPQEYWQCAEIFISMAPSSAPSGVPSASVQPSVSPSESMEPSTEPSKTPSDYATVSVGTPGSSVSSETSVGCCTQNGECVTGTHDCYSYQNCGVNNGYFGVWCSWNNQLSWVGPAPPGESPLPTPEEIGCCTRNGLCVTGSHDCYSYQNCGVDNGYFNVWCSWNDQLSWAGPVPAGESPLPTPEEIGCCTQKETGMCVWWDDPCFSYENCGYTPGCQSLEWAGSPPEGSPAQSELGCCTVNGVCATGEHVCYQYENCGFTSDCSWAEWFGKIPDGATPHDEIGCCAVDGGCVSWSHPCFTYENCGVDSTADQIWCNWSGRLAWHGPTP